MHLTDSLSDTEKYFRGRNTGKENNLQNSAMAHLQVKKDNRENIRKTVFVPFIEDLELMSYKDVAGAMELNANRQYIDHANWKEYPYAPIAVFDISRSRTHIFIRYFVKGEDLRAVHGNDNETIWHDSCVEFFVREPGSDRYYNFEINCIGACLGVTRSNDNDKSQLPLADMARIIRHTSLGKKSFEEKTGIFSWEVIAGIPFDLFGVDPDDLPDTLRANFYKCADKTAHPHFVSWNPITSGILSFHQPEYFGELRFKK